MKRLAGYFLCLFVLCIMFSACYYLSYQNALRKFNKDSVERNANMMLNFAEYQKQEELLLSKAAKSNNTTYAASNNSNASNTDPSTDSPGTAILATGDEEESIVVDASNNDTILPTTKYYLLTYNMKTDELLTEQLTPPSELIGLTRTKVIEKLADYMDNVPLSDYEKGLYAYELLSFSKDEVMIRKSYNSDLIPYKYYMVVEDGKIVIYYSDMKTVYEYTNIEAMNLPEEARNQLMNGIYIKDTDELFTLLESFTS